MSEDARKTIESIERQMLDIEEKFIGGLIRDSMSEEEWDALTDEEYSEIFNRLISRPLIPVMDELPPLPTEDIYVDGVKIYDASATPSFKWEDFLNHMNGLNK